jgi:outer membrane protein assembly factor BamB
MRLRLALLALAVIPAVTVAQYQPMLRTYPAPLPREALDRLNLALGWSVLLPPEGPRDGIAGVQMFDNQVVVLMRSARIIAIDGRTGETLWRSRAGNPYPPVMLPLAANANALFFVNGTRLYVIDRGNGGVRAGFDLDGAPATPPVSDGEFLYIGMGNNRVYAYLLTQDKPAPFAPPSPPTPKPGPPLTPETPRMPSPGTPEAPLNIARAAETPGGGVSDRAVTGYPGGPPAPSLFAVQSVVPPYRLNNTTAPSLFAVPSVVPPYNLNNGASTPSIAAVGSVTTLNPIYAIGPTPKLIWDVAYPSRLVYPPVLGDELLLVAGSNRTLQANAKSNSRPGYEFTTTSPVSAPMGQYRATAYIPTSDATVYAIGVDNGHLLWRYTSFGPVVRRPIASDEELYLTVSQGGLERVERSTGQGIWSNPEIHRFLAANDRYVYTMGRLGDLHVLDRARGSILATLDTRDFVVPVVNDQDDRVFLAAQNGLILSLHDRNLPNPRPLRSPPPPPPPAAPGTRPGTPPPAAPPPPGAGKPAADTGK